MARLTALPARPRQRGSEERLSDQAWDELLRACEARFPAPHYDVRCDDRHTTWIKRRDGRRSVGLSQWLLREHSLSELLQHAEDRLAE